jgi:hypothetical protein
VALLEQEQQNYFHLLQIQERTRKRIQRQSRLFLWFGLAFVTSQTLRLVMLCWKAPCFNPKMGFEELWPWYYCGILYLGTLLGCYLSIRLSRVLLLEKSQSQPVWSFQRWIQSSKSRSIDIQQAKSLANSIERISYYRNVLVLLR